jgi:hypothetical protein
MTNPIKPRLIRLLSRAAAPANGKPLDKCTLLNHKGCVTSGRTMRNARLYRDSDDKWRVTCHNNLIAEIDTSNDYTLVTIHSANTWPTRTTAERLTSILGSPVGASKRRLWLFESAMSKPPKYVPLWDGAVIRLEPNRLPTIVNREGIYIDKTRVNRDKAKPFNAYLRKLKAVATAVVRVSEPNYDDVAARTKEKYGGWQDRTAFLELAFKHMPEPDYEVVVDLLRVGFQYSCIGRPSSQQVLNTGLRQVKDYLFSLHNVYYKERAYEDGRVETL